MYQPFNQQNVLPVDIGFVAEEDLHHVAGEAALRTTVLRLDELAHDWNLDRAYQIRHKHERIFQHGEHLNRLALVVIGDLPPKLLDAFLDLVRRNDGPQWFDSDAAHELWGAPGHRSVLLYLLTCRTAMVIPESPLRHHPVWQRIGLEQESRASR